MNSEVLNSFSGTLTIGGEVSGLCGSRTIEDLTKRNPRCQTEKKTFYAHTEVIEFLVGSGLVAHAARVLFVIFLLKA